MSQKRSKPKPQKTRPGFDVEPIDDDEQPPFTLDDDGNMILRRKAAPPAQEKPRGKGSKKPAG